MAESKKWSIRHIVIALAVIGFVVLLLWPTSVNQGGDDVATGGQSNATAFRVVEAGGTTGDGMLTVRFDGDQRSCTRTFEGDPFPMVVNDRPNIPGGDSGPQADTIFFGDDIVTMDPANMGMAPGVRLECPTAMIVILDSGGLPYEAEP